MKANAVDPTVLGSIQASSDTVESEGRSMKQCVNEVMKNEKIKKISLKKKCMKRAVTICREDSLLRKVT
jgi:hypothetical protein